MEEVEWGEYKIKELFDSVTGDFDIQKRHINNSGEFVVTAGLTDNGVLGKSDVEARVIDANTITIDMFGNSFYRQFKYKLVTHARVFALIPKFKMSEKQGLFIVNSFKTLPTMFGYENMCSWTKIKDRLIKLPIKDNQIDFDFMDTFIAELEAERIAELSAYLKVSGLDNYELSDEELKALRDYDSMEWREYRIGSLFSRISTKKLPYKAKNLPTEALDDYDLPCLTSSFRNQGLNYYVPREGATILKDVISIPSNSDVYRAYFQSREFTVLSDAYAIKWTDEDRNLSNYQYLFMVRAINKVTDLPIYSYKMKLGGWNVVKDKKILLPVIDDEIAFNFMEDYARAISKLAIKDVVQYTDRRIEATEEVVKGHQENR